jgi:NhaA family Na+:H+ antiporter
MLLAVFVALLWVNSPWGDSYHRVWEAPLEIGLGAWALEMELKHWINDGLIVLFFLVVTLEIRREVTIGELATLRGAALPFTAAAGGMLTPVLLYLLFNAGTPTAGGWGIPMGTDTAFALGLLAILGSRVPLSLRVFVAAAAIADDVGGIAVIALFYTDQIVLPSLIMALLLWAPRLRGNDLGMSVFQILHNDQVIIIPSNSANIAMLPSNGARKRS